MLINLHSTYEYAKSEIGQISDNGFMSQNDCDRWANEGYRKYNSMLRRFDEGFFEKQISLDLTANTATIALPSQFLGVTLLERKINDTEYVPMVYKKRDDPTGNSSSSGSSYIPQYEFLGRNLLLNPVPTATETSALRMKMKYDPPQLNQGLVVNATATTITFADTADVRDDYYNDAEIIITSGTGIGQIRTISDYVGSTKIATISSDWDIIPVTTSKYSTIIDTNFPSDFDMLIPLYVAKKAFSSERSPSSGRQFDMDILKDLERDFINTYESRSDGRRFVEQWEPC